MVNGRNTCAVVVLALLLAALPPAAMARSLTGTVLLEGSARIHGYKALVGGDFNGRRGDLDVTLSKTSGGLTQSHLWTVDLRKSAFKLNRSRASIVVKKSLGARGLISFHFSARPRRVGSGCGVHARGEGTLRGTIRIKVGDRYFKTIVIRRLKATVEDSGSCVPGSGASFCPTGLSLSATSSGDPGPVRPLDIEVSPQGKRLLESFFIDEPTPH